MNELALQHNNLIIYQTISYLNAMAFAEVITFLVALRQFELSKMFMTSLLSISAVSSSMIAFGLGLLMRFGVIGAVIADLSNGNVIGVESLNSFAIGINMQVLLCFVANVNNIICISRRGKK